MLFRIEYLIELNLIVLFVYLIYKTTPKNRNHLSYLKIHLGTIILTISLFIGILNKWIPEASLPLISGLSILGLPFLLLHVESAITGRKPRIRIWYFTPITIYCLVCALNYYDIFFLNFITSRYLILDVNVVNSSYSLDKVLIEVLNILLFVSLIFYKFRKKMLTSRQIFKKRAYSFWIYSYLIFLLIHILLTAAYYFDFFKPIHHPIVRNIIAVISPLVHVTFLLNPSLLYYLPLILTNSGIKVKKNTQPFQIIENIMHSEQLFLDKNLTLEHFCTITNINQQKTTTLIKENTNNNNNNWKHYVNNYRINHALNLLLTHYLQKHSVEALREESGFNSKQPFFKAFRTKTGTTPTVYYQNFINNSVEV